MITYFFTVTIRSEAKPMYDEFSRYIRASLEKSLPLSIFLLECMSTDLLTELFVEADTGVFRYELAGLVAQACQTCYLHEEEALLNFMRSTKENVRDPERLIHTNSRGSSNTVRRINTEIRDPITGR